MEILDLVLRRLDTENSSPEIEGTVVSVGQYIKEYCFLEEITEDLYPLWADMVYDLLKDTAGGGPDITGLTSVSIGDVSYSFGNSGEGALVGAAPLLANYRHRLNKVRRGLFR